jgi:acetoin:2,6-dichlorophenolindophenol oxidoreductase subunit alpha
MTTRTKSKSHPHAALPDAGNGSLISDQRLVELYSAMLRCRILRERIRGFAGSRSLRKFASGTESVAAAAVIGLLPEDLVISSAPHLCAALLKGVPLSEILRPLCARPSVRRRRSAADQSHLAAGLLVAFLAGANRLRLSVGALAAGAAFAGKCSRRDFVAVAFCDEAGTKYSLRSLFDFALAHQLPLIFVRQSASQLQPASHRGKSSPQSRDSSPMPIIPVDSNDAVAVYRVAHEAIAHARRDSGPTLIDCVPVRLAGERKRDSDCILRMEHYLEAKGLRPEKIKSSVTAKFTRAFDRALAAARSHPRANRRVRRSSKTGK